jgi:hypothetical protein
MLQPQAVTNLSFYWMRRQQMLPVAKRPLHLLDAPASRGIIGAQASNDFVLLKYVIVEFFACAV